MQHRLHGLRRSNYIAKYNQLYGDLEKDIKEDFYRIKRETGKFSARDLGSIAVKYRLPLTVLDEFMSGYGLMPPGIWEKLKNSINKSTGKKFAAKDIGVEWE